jgi:C-terminal processing protease CtpA/Prc
LTTTNAAGLFQLGNVPDGPVSLRASADGFNSRIASTVSAASPIDFLLTPIPLDAGRKTELVGIGAVMRGRGQALVLGEVFPGGGAAAAGLAPGDQIVSVDGTPVAQLGFAISIVAIRGLADTTVVLGVVSAGGAIPRPVSVVRQPIVW